MIAFLRYNVIDSLSYRYLHKGVWEGLAELGLKAASEYSGAKLWLLLNSRALVKTDEVEKFKQLFSTSSVIPCCLVLMLLPLDQPLTHNQFKYRETKCIIYKMKVHLRLVGLWHSTITKK